MTPGSGEQGLEVSVVMPCLNEADTLATCVGKALPRLRERGSRGRSSWPTTAAPTARDIAGGAGARVVPVAGRATARALMGGIAAARGRYVIMGDADDSYDFLEIPKFVAKLREGFELVQGCRLPSGGGTRPAGRDAVAPPVDRQPAVLAARALVVPRADARRLLRHARLPERPLGLDQRCTGMEFATEMIIKSPVRRRIAEVPITLHPDGRKSHAPHLKTFRDGWRTLRFS